MILTPLRLLLQIPYRTRLFGALLGLALLQIAFLHFLFWYTPVTAWAIGARVVVVVGMPFGATLLANALASWLAQRFRQQLLDRLAQTPTQVIEQWTAQEYSKAITLDIDQLSMFWRDYLLGVGFNVPVLLYLLGAFLWQQRSLEVLAIGALLGFLGLLAFMLNRRTRHLHKRLHRQYLQLHGHVRQYLETILPLRLYQREAAQAQRLRADFDHYQRESNHLNLYRQLYMVSQSVALLGFLWGGLWVMRTYGTLSVSELAVATVVLLEVRRIVATLFSALNQFQRHRDTARRLVVWPALALPPTPPAVPHAPAPIQLAGLAFTYGKRPTSIQYPAFDVLVGDRIWLKGENGRGKSTLWKILTGLYTDPHAPLRIGEQIVHGNGLHPLWQRVAAVTEPPLSFNGRVWEIIGNFEASREAVEHWLNDHNLLPFLGTFPHGLDSFYDASQRSLSAGQVKWVTLLQAFFARPHLLILDEPFSSLDEARCRATVALIDALPPTTTLLVISHQPVPFAVHKTVLL